MGLRQGSRGSHVEDDRQLRGRVVLGAGGGVFGHEVGDGRADGAAADVVVAGQAAGGEVHRGERAVVDAQGEAAGVQHVEDVEDVLRAAYEAEHLGDVHGVARPRVGEQIAELRALEGVEAAGVAGLYLERDRVLDPGLAEDEVLPVGRHPLVDQVGHAAPRVRCHSIVTDCP
nr:hypothetical protein [Frankia sp. Cas4]